MDAKKIIEALISNAKCTYEFDVTTGQLENDIIGSDGTNYTQKAGLSAPCSFNDLVDKYFGAEMNCSMLIGSQLQKISSEYLLEAYLSGKKAVKLTSFIHPPMSITEHCFFCMKMRKVDMLWHLLSVG